MPVEAHEVADEGREAGACEEPPLAALEAPILERGEVDSERDLPAVPTVPIWSRRLLRITAGPHEVEYGLGARGGPIADADLEHPNPAVHLVVGRLVQVDWRLPRSSGQWLP